MKQPLLATCRSVALGLTALLGLILPNTYAQQPSGTLVVAEVGDHTNFDPAVAGTPMDRSVQYVLYNSLVRWDENLLIRPDLATTWELSEDSRTWTFHLDPSAVFADGTPVTAGDVVFSIERVLDPATRAPYRSQYTIITELEAVDDHTVAITTGSAFPDLLEALADGSVDVLSRAFVGQVGADYGKSAETTLGSGPYQLLSWQPGSLVVLEPNLNYWREPGPRLARIEIRPITEGIVRSGMATTGEADVANKIPPEQIERLRRESGVSILEASSAQQLGLEFNVTAAPLDDVRVRQALRYAIDYEGIIEFVLGGQAVLSVGPVGPVGGRSEFSPWPYDPERSRELLREAGAEGARIVISSPNGRYLKDAQIAQAIQSNWQAVGLEVELELLEWATFLEQQTADSERMVALVGRSAPYLDSILWRLYHTSSTLAPSQEILFHGYQNAQVDALLEQGRSTFNFDERLTFYNEAEQIIWEESPTAWLWTWQQVIAVREEVEGFRVNPRERFMLDEVTVND